MVLPEMRLVQSAIVLAEELHFFRAAVRLGIDQSALTKRIIELESLLDVRLFERNHQKVELTEAGAKFVEHACLGVVHIEDAVTSARAAISAILFRLIENSSVFACPVATCS